MPKPRATNHKQNASALGFSDPRSEWFIKDEPQPAEAADTRDFSLSASIPFSASDGEKVAQPDEVCSRDNGERIGVRCRIPRNADSFRADLHPDLKADFVPVRKDLANPPFNMSDWGGENLRQDMRWKFGMPPVNNANYACRSLRNSAFGLRPSRRLSPVGVAGFVMANGAMSTQTSNEGEIRKALIEADLANAITNN
jgi:hypothetical protein